MKRMFFSAALVVLLLLLAIRPAHAYLDPATGSMILQVLVAAIAAAAITIKAFWHRIRGFFGGSPGAEEVEAEDRSE